MEFELNYNIILSKSLSNSLQNDLLFFLNFAYRLLAFTQNEFDIS